MDEEFDNNPAGNAVEEQLRAALLQGDDAMRHAGPILRHLLANSDQALFSDEVIARIRGMLKSISKQLLLEFAREAEVSDPGEFCESHCEAFAVNLYEDAEFLEFAHVLTLEAQTAERLMHRSQLDAVLSPLLQKLIGSKDEALAANAMHVLTAQARFMRQMRRMELPLYELPGDLFHKALQLVKEQNYFPKPTAKPAIRNLRKRFDESKARLGLITRLIMAMERHSSQALSLDHAGLAIFTSALSMASSQSREQAIFSLGKNQYARFALGLRAAGLSKSELEQQVLFLHPNGHLPEGIADLPSGRAIALLNAAPKKGEL